MSTLTRDRTPRQRSRPAQRPKTTRTPTGKRQRRNPEPSPRRQQLIEEWLPIAHRLAMRFAHRGEPLEDLQQVAAFGLVKAAEGYDSSYGQGFRSYAIPTIVGELRRHFRDTGWDVRVSRRLQERGMELSHARGELTSSLGRSPTATELAGYLGLTREEVWEAMAAARAYSATSLQTPLKSDGDSSGELGDLLGECDSHYELTEDLMALRPALAQLSRTERSVVAMRFYDELTQSQIARRIGSSQMQVSRMLSRILVRLRAQLSIETS